jgi:hypothetical protein
MNGVCFEMLIDQRGSCALLGDGEEGIAKRFLPSTSLKLDQVFWMFGLTCLLFIQDLSFVLVRASLVFAASCSLHSEEDVRIAIR